MSKESFKCKCDNEAFVIYIDKMLISCTLCKKEYDIIYVDDYILGGKFNIIRKDSNIK
jgi:hypothetical protein